MARSESGCGEEAKRKRKDNSFHNRKVLVDFVLIKWEMDRKTVVGKSRKA